MSWFLDKQTEIARQQAEFNNKLLDLRDIHTELDALQNQVRALEKYLDISRQPSVHQFSSGHTVLEAYRKIKRCKICKQEIK